MSRGRYYTNAELDCVMGFPSLPLPGNELYRNAMAGLEVYRLPRAKYVKLIGNGMHVAAMYAFFAYMLANCVRRADMDRITFSVLAVSSRISDFDSEAEEAEAPGPRGKRLRRRSTTG